MADRCAALVVSGYLGSGKTSLVRHLLACAQRDGLRVAVVSNELGELGVDAELLAAREDDYVELSGGCVCCRLSGALIETLEDLRARVSPDRVLVETSGVALPFETQLQLWRPPLCDWIEDDVSVVVVNAEQLAAGRDLDDTFAQQVSSADLLLLNQTDRVDAGRLPALHASLRELEPEAPILQAVHGRVDPDLLFPPDAERLRARRREEPAEAPPHDHERFATELLALPDGLDEAALRERVRASGALRAKGFVVSAQGLRLLQAVGPRVELSAPPRTPPAELVGRVVAIRRA